MNNNLKMLATKDIKFLVKIYSPRHIRSTKKWAKRLARVHDRRHAKLMAQGITPRKRAFRVSAYIF